MGYRGQVSERTLRNAPFRTLVLTSALLKSRRSLSLFARASTLCCPLSNTRSRVFHNYWAPMIFKCRLPIFVLTIGFVIMAGIVSSMVMIPADKPPSFFSKEHNIGMLEIVNQDYVASVNMDLDAADAAAWGLIDNLPDGSDEGGGDGSGNSNFCPVVNDAPCDGHGVCNSITMSCVCFSGYDGVDCSTKLESDKAAGNLVPSEANWVINDFSLGATVITKTIEVSNTGETNLRWYFFEGDDSGNFLSIDSVPAWLTFAFTSSGSADHSGIVAAEKSSVITLSFDPAEMECSTTTCDDEFDWVFSHTGLNGISTSMSAKLNRKTYAPTDSPTLSPTLAPSATPTPAPTMAPTTPAPSTSPTFPPTMPPTMSPTFAPTSSPTSSPTRSLCTNGAKDASNGETDVDCGGDNCPKCGGGLDCAIDDDCQSWNCDGGACGAAPTSSPTLAPTLAPTSKFKQPPSAHALR